MVRIIDFDMGCPLCKDGAQLWKMLMQLIQIWTVPHLSLVFMMAMEVHQFAGKAVAKFCAKYLHQQVLKHAAYSAGDLGNALQKSFLRMDEMMHGQRGWRELAILGDKIEKVSGMIEGFLWSPRSGDVNGHVDDWSSEEGPHSDFQGPNSGCTACVAIIRENQLVVANAGDSRCVISRKGQVLSFCSLLITSPNKLKLWVVLAHTPKQIVTANPDINTVELCDDDEFLVLACDGIWDCMSSQQLVDYVREQLNNENKLSAICEKVFNRCLAPVAGGEGCDNMTMIIVQFKRPVTSGASVEEQSLSSDQPAQTTANIDEPSQCNRSIVKVDEGSTETKEK
ncbi:protein phosphatase 2c, putative [Ricinus communis]|uniref:Protein phosphatase 2c, putative n=1 Tax=Ricinus communis TaxID=3988 RepID=B9RGM9_RICCO|nr:protein phosphatase 2c, putative [Ricinus communis]